MIDKKDLIVGAVKAIQVLESFSAQRQRLNATQAAERTGLTRAAARRHLLTLADLGYLEGKDGFFWLAPRVLRLAGAYLSSARLPKAVQPTLNRLAADTGAAFSVAVLDGLEVVIVARSGEHRSHSSVLPHGIHLGARLPALATSTGRVILAARSGAEQREFLAKAKPIAFTPHTVTAATPLFAELRRIKKSGYAEAHEEHEIGVRALAVPLRDDSGQVIAALNIVETGPVRRWTTPGAKPGASSGESEAASPASSQGAPQSTSLSTRFLDQLLRASGEIRSLW
jgi:IclR family transcriptional regulator, pca regulon regulatory protein